MKVTLDKCPEGSETPCFGPYAQNVQDYQGFKATREVPLEVQSLERETSHAIEMEASLARAARAARARNASSAAANGSAAAEAVASSSTTAAKLGRASRNDQSGAALASPAGA